MKKVFWLIVIIGGLGFVGFYGWRLLEKAREEPGERRPQSVAVERRTIASEIDANGIIEPEISVEIRSEISGRIENVLVEDGALVERGDVLVELDQRTLKNELHEAEINVDAFRLRLEQSERNLRRLAALRQDDFARESEFLDAETELALARIEMSIRESRLETARENLERATIRAPRAGRISELKVNEGQVIVGATSVNQGTLLMRVNDMGRLIVRARINELQVTRLREDNPVEVSFNAIPGLRIAGRIDRISQFGEAEGSARVFPVEVGFPASDERLKAGITANLRFPVERVENVPAVLVSAVFRQGGREYVIVDLGDGRTEHRQIQTGLNNLQFIQVKSGLEPGERVMLTRPSGMDRIMGGGRPGGGRGPHG